MTVNIIIVVTFCSKWHRLSLSHIVVNGISLMSRPYSWTWEGVEENRMDYEFEDALGLRHTHLWEELLWNFGLEFNTAGQYLVWHAPGAGYSRRGVCVSRWRWWVFQWGPRRGSYTWGVSRTSERMIHEGVSKISRTTILRAEWSGGQCCVLSRGEWWVLLRGPLTKTTTTLRRIHVTMSLSRRPMVTNLWRWF